MNIGRTHQGGRRRGAAPVEELHRDADAAADVGRPAARCREYIRRSTASWSNRSASTRCSTPIRRVVGSRLTADKEPAAPAVTPTRAARRLRVLVAEDNPVNQKLAQHLLERRGHTPILAANGREALDLATARSVRPGPDGSADARDGRLRSDGRRFAPANATRARHALPIIALTAHAMQGDRQRCLDADMDGYVAKPIKPVELFEVIDRVMAAAGNTCRRNLRVRDVSMAGPRNVR